MKLLAPLRTAVKPALSHFPKIRKFAHDVEEHVDVARHSMAQVWPGLIRPDPREIFVTLTANCNLRCVGCRYGREFMSGSQLPLPIVLDLLDDTKALGLRSVRLYGGEPLLHKDLPQIVEHAVQLGLHTWLTTNGILLRQKVDALYAAGLREIAVGFYGTGGEYEGYVQRNQSYAKMEGGIAYTRERYGSSVKLDLGWLLMRPTCRIDALHAAWEFALRYQAPLTINLIHYSLPYFTEGPNRELAFRPEDRPRLEEIVTELLRLKRDQPEMLTNTETGLRSIPDWLLRGPAMRVPCDRYRLIWIGANGVVQLCYVTFVLGNLHENRLRDLLFTAAHAEASRDAFALNCPNCHCSFDERTRLHAPSRRAYGKDAAQLT
jgi:MoaA/NifB/PqqE/SkfB family radical SAM enzyme